MSDINVFNKAAARRHNNRYGNMFFGGGWGGGVEEENRMSWLDDMPEKKPGNNQSSGASFGDIAGAASGLLGNAMSSINLYAKNLGSADMDTTKQGFMNQWSKQDLLSQSAAFGPAKFTNSAGMSALQDGLNGAAAGTSIMPGWGCVCAGTRVITAKGEFINVEDLCQEDGIVGFNGMCAEAVDIKGMQDPAFKECVEITTNTGKVLRCSNDHPILFSPGGKPTREYSITENNTRYRHRVREWDWQEASKLQEGDNVAIIDEVPIFGKEKLPNARLIGMLIGDGTYNGNRGVRLHTADPDTWRYCESLGYDSYEKRQRPGQKELRTYAIKGFSDTLKELGMYNQAREEKRLPEQIHLYDKQSICDLVSGLFDTDGHVYPKRGRAFFTQSNLDLIKQVQELLIKLGIHTTLLTSDAKDKVINGRVVHSKKCYRITVTDKESFLNLAKNCQLIIGYKQEALDNGVKYFENRKGRSITPGIFCERVISVTPVGMQRIYNLEADKHHTYIANLIVTHNTAIGGVAGTLAGGLTAVFGNKRLRRQQRRMNQMMSGQVANQNALINQNSLSNYYANNNAFGGFEAGVPLGPHFAYNEYARGRDMGHGLQGPTFNSKGVSYPQRNITVSNKFARGGFIPNNGMDINDRFSVINKGGTHEENPFGGIAVSIGENGEPNLVEEGEVRWDNYIFSNRLKVDPKATAKMGIPEELIGLPTTLTNKKFADAAMSLQKEAEERPADPISIRGRDAMLGRLQMSQELQKIKDEMAGKGTAGNQFAMGGSMNYGDPPRTRYWGGITDPKDEDYVGLVEAEDSSRINPFYTNATLNDPFVSRFHSNMKGLLDKYKDNPLDVKSGNQTLYDRMINPRSPYEQYLPISWKKYPDATPGQDIKDRKGSWFKSDQFDNALRYAPVVANSGITAALAAQKPDKMELERMSYQPITDRMSYTPMDREYYAGTIRQQANATARALMDSSAGNAGIAQAMLLANNRQAQESIGKGIFDMEKENMTRRDAAIAFNAEVNKFNAQQQMQADQINLQQSNNERDFNAKARAARRTAIYSGIGNIASNLGAIGKENFQAKTIRNTYGYDGRTGEYALLDSILKDMKEGEENTFNGKKFKKKGNKAEFIN
jgi:intein/homing endonuclease